MQTDSENRIVRYRPAPGSEYTRDFTAKGKGLPEHNCFEVMLEGRFVKDDKNGETFIVKDFQTKVKPTRANILGYLASGAVKGIGATIAKRIVDHFGDESLNILEHAPDRLREVSGIGEQTLEDIKRSFSENHEINAVLLYVGQFYADEIGNPDAKSPISKKKAKRIVDHFGGQALEVIRQDIYHLCEVDGFGFKTVDTMAVRMKMPMNTLPRVKAAAMYTLGENRQKGHLCMEPIDFLKALKSNLNHKKTSYKMAESELRPLANESLMCKEISYNHKSIYLLKDCGREKVFADVMARRIYYDRAAVNNTEWPSLVSQGYELAPEQKRAAMMALQLRTFILTGGPGTGKTTVIKTIVETFRRDNPKNDGILLCAPTGRAAKRMAESTGFPAFTAHKGFGLLSEDANTSRTAEAAKELDLVILDECSMADQWLMYKIITLISPETKLIMVGDANQLPSVGPGNVLHEMINSGIVPYVQLKTVFRQTEGSSIAENAQRISESVTELKFDDDFCFFPAKNQEDAMYYICALYKKIIAECGRDMVQILTPVRREGHLCGVINLNNVVQRMIQEDPEIGFEHYGSYFCKGDPVMQIKNADGIYNGEMGVIAETAPDKIHVQYVGNDALTTYNSENIGLIELAYSQTVHKSQGCEFPYVVFPVLKEHFGLSRNLLYTAITRAKQKVFLIGSMWALKKAITTEDTSERGTHLAQRMQEVYHTLAQADGGYDLERKAG
jgi:exodeoxyribonuclease V alpha subunit